MIHLHISHLLILLMNHLLYLRQSSVEADLGLDLCFYLQTHRASQPCHEGRAAYGPTGIGVGRKPHLVIMDHCLSAFRHRYRLGSALLEHFSLQPILESLCELFPSTRKAMFRRKGSSLGRPLIFRDVSILHHELALPDTCKWQVPEVAVYDMLKA